MTGHIIHEIPLEVFVNFLPAVIGSPTPRIEFDFNGSSKAGSKKEEMYGPIETRRPITLLQRLNQQISYASQIMSLQHRSHVFSISTIGNYARLIRWDRTGASVSSRFNYVQADQDEINLLDGAVKEHLRKFRYPAHLDVEISRTVDGSYPAYKVRVVDQATKEESEYIVCRPFVDDSDLCGRATRGYLAWGVNQQKLVFLKDAWRAEGVDGTLSEAEAYTILRGLNLESLTPLLPVIYASGDVYLSDGTPQCTLTQDLADPRYQSSQYTGEWLGKHTRHRVVQEIALPLRMVRNAKDLLKAIRNTLEVIKLVHKEGHILHRDISLGNIMLNTDFEGILNDWDLAIHTDEAKKGSSSRTGTWKFMSTRILMDETKPHTIHDDVESIFWVLYYVALHYFKISSGREKFYPRVFDEYYVETIGPRSGHGPVRYVTGGNAKYSALAFRDIHKITFRNAHLTRVIHEFADLVGGYLLFRRLAEDRSRRVRNPQSVIEIQREWIKPIEEVDLIIKIFDEEIAASEGWGEGDHDDDGPVEDQFPPRPLLVDYYRRLQARQMMDSSTISTGSPCQGDSSRNTSSPINSTLGHFTTVGEELVTRCFRPAAPTIIQDSGSLPSESCGTSSKRCLDDSEDLEVGPDARSQRAKRRRLRKESQGQEKEKTGFVMTLSTTPVIMFRSL
ncbi:hypothetical protein BDY19DRAFT_905574 [Irpex rosettiformis]|uniref:Uncharacterized protein n=1 Tax=Irpex rosettiformis TaxID=378272 RepID=A0ACB8U6D1_9APHY|nr:hypothetical protein BDY19DRAFT_905574 [Irpex rosettiformis]